MRRRVLMAMMSAAILLVPGCVGFRSMDNQNKLPEAFVSACARLRIAPTRFSLAVNVSRQAVSLFEEDTCVKIFPCSTSRFGIGQIEGSNCTPRGLHRIAEKIGGGEPAGTVFKSREVIGHTSQPEFADSKITTRILWLCEMNPDWF